MDKKIILRGLQILAVLIVIFLGYFLFGKTKNKNLVLIVDKVYSAYGEFISDIGKSPSGIEELYENTLNDHNWKGPYISEKTLAEYSKGKIDVIHASIIPTKRCPLDSFVNCYSWIMVENVSQSTFSQIKNSIPKSAAPFYASNKLYLKITQVE